MSPRSIPHSAFSAHSDKKIPSLEHQDFNNLYPCWRFGNFDIESKWGIQSLGHEFIFNYSDTILEALCSCEEGPEINKLNRVFEECNNRSFGSIFDFWQQVSIKCPSVKIPVNVVHVVRSDLSTSFFMQKVFPKLKQYETNTWYEIQQYVHGQRGRSQNHFVDVKDLIPAARNRLDKTVYRDVDQLFSLRLSGTLRIYGVRKFNWLDILWIDAKHEIYPSKKK